MKIRKGKGLSFTRCGSDSGVSSDGISVEMSPPQSMCLGSQSHSEKMRNRNTNSTSDIPKKSSSSEMNSTRKRHHSAGSSSSDNPIVFKIPRKRLKSNQNKKLTDPKLPKKKNEKRFTLQNFVLKDKAAKRRSRILSSGSESDSSEVCKVVVSDLDLFNNILNLNEKSTSNECKNKVPKSTKNVSKNSKNKTECKNITQEHKNSVLPIKKSGLESSLPFKKRKSLMDLVQKETPKKIKGKQKKCINNSEQKTTVESQPNIDKSKKTKKNSVSETETPKPDIEIETIEEEIENLEIVLSEKEETNKIKKRKISIQEVINLEINQEIFQPEEISETKTPAKLSKAVVVLNRQEVENWLSRTSAPSSSTNNCRIMVEKISETPERPKKCLVLNRDWDRHKTDSVTKRKFTFNSTEYMSKITSKIDQFKDAKLAEGFKFEQERRNLNRSLSQIKNSESQSCLELNKFVNNYQKRSTISTTNVLDYEYNTKQIENSQKLNKRPNLNRSLSNEKTTLPTETQSCSELNKSVNNVPKTSTASSQNTTKVLDHNSSECTENIVLQKSSIKDNKSHKRQSLKRELSDKDIQKKSEQPTNQIQSCSELKSVNKVPKTSTICSQSTTKVVENKNSTECTEHAQKNNNTSEKSSNITKDNKINKRQSLRNRKLSDKDIEKNSEQLTTQNQSCSELINKVPKSSTTYQNTTEVLEHKNSEKCTENIKKNVSENSSSIIKDNKIHKRQSLSRKLSDKEIHKNSEQPAVETKFCTELKSVNKVPKTSSLTKTRLQVKTADRINEESKHTKVTNQENKEMNRTYKIVESKLSSMHGLLDLDDVEDYIQENAIETTQSFMYSDAEFLSQIYDTIPKYPDSDYIYDDGNIDIEEEKFNWSPEEIENSELTIAELLDTEIYSRGQNTKHVEHHKKEEEKQNKRLSDEKKKEKIVEDKKKHHHSTHKSKKPEVKSTEHQNLTEKSKKTNETNKSLKPKKSNSHETKEHDKCKEQIAEKSKRSSHERKPHKDSHENKSQKHLEMPEKSKKNQELCKETKEKHKEKHEKAKKQENKSQNHVEVPEKSKKTNEMCKETKEKHKESLESAKEQENKSQKHVEVLEKSKKNNEMCKETKEKHKESQESAKEQENKSQKHVEVPEKSKKNNEMRKETKEKHRELQEKAKELENKSQKHVEMSEKTEINNELIKESRKHKEMQENAKDQENKTQQNVVMQLKNITELYKEYQIKHKETQEKLKINELCKENQVRQNEMETHKEIDKIEFKKDSKNEKESNTIEEKSKNQTIIDKNVKDNTEFKKQKTDVEETKNEKESGDNNKKPKKPSRREVHTVMTPTNTIPEIKITINNTPESPISSICTPDRPITPEIIFTKPKVFKLERNEVKRPPTRPKKIILNRPSLVSSVQSTPSTFKVPETPNQLTTRSLLNQKLDEVQKKLSCPKMQHKEFDAISIYADTLAESLPDTNTKENSSDSDDDFSVCSFIPKMDPEKESKMKEWVNSTVSVCETSICLSMFDDVCDEYKKSGEKCTKLCSTKHELPDKWQDEILKLSVDQVMSVYNYSKNLEFLYKSIFSVVTSRLGELRDFNNLISMVKDVLEIELNYDRAPFISDIINALCKTGVSFRTTVEIVYKNANVDSKLLDLLGDILLNLTVEKNDAYENWSVMKTLISNKNYDVDEGVIRLIIVDCLKGDPETKDLYSKIYNDLLKNISDAKFGYISESLLNNFYVRLKNHHYITESTEFSARCQKLCIPLGNKSDHCSPTTPESNSSTPKNKNILKCSPYIPTPSTSSTIPPLLRPETYIPFNKNTPPVIPGPSFVQPLNNFAQPVNQPYFQPDFSKPPPNFLPNFNRNQFGQNRRQKQKNYRQEWYPQKPIFSAYDVKQAVYREDIPVILSFIIKYKDNDHTDIFIKTCFDSLMESSHNFQIFFGKLFETARIATSIDDKTLMYVVKTLAMNSILHLYQQNNREQAFCIYMMMKKYINDDVFNVKMYLKEPCSYTKRKLIVAHLLLLKGHYDIAWDMIQEFNFQIHGAFGDKTDLIYRKNVIDEFLYCLRNRPGINSRRKIWDLGVEIVVHCVANKIEIDVIKHINGIFLHAINNKCDVHFFVNFVHNSIPNWYNYINNNIFRAIIVYSIQNNLFNFGKQIFLTALARDVYPPIFGNDSVITFKTDYLLEEIHVIFDDFFGKMIPFYPVRHSVVVKIEPMVPYNEEVAKILVDSTSKDVRTLQTRIANVLNNIFKPPIIISSRHNVLSLDVSSLNIYLKERFQKNM